MMEQNEKKWEIAQPDENAVKLLCREMGCHPITAGVLVNRKITSMETARPFMRPTIKDIRPPFDIRDLDIAVKRIHQALTAKEKILIFGDYDVDGVTATGIVYEFLRAAGADVTPYIPHRSKEGYGLRRRHVTQIAAPLGIKLIITVDCGTGSHNAALAAKRAGIDLIITDHHQVCGDLPQALAVVNPKRPDCTSGLDHLAGVGVAFYLLISLRKYMREADFWKEGIEPNLKDFCDLVALGTVADVVPLIAENRIFSRAGLDVINNGCRPGLLSLMRASGIKGKCSGSGDIAFRLAPRINAAGRLSHAKAALDLLTSTCPDEADRIAQGLCQLNAERQRTQRKMVEEIIKEIEKKPHLLEKHSLVLAKEGWHDGVIGIVASKLVDLYFRPVILIRIEDGMAKGSGRSIPGVLLHEALGDCADHLDRFGGHAMAAGLSLKAENIEAFAHAFDDAVCRGSRPEDFIPRLFLDGRIELSDITPQLIDELEDLQPFGEGNPEPLFIAEDISVVHSKTVGRYHRKMMLRPAGDRLARAVAAIHFHPAPEDMKICYFERIAFNLAWNRYQDQKIPQIMVREL